MRRQAFSLVELLVALVLLTVGLAAFVRAAGAVAQLDSLALRRRRVADVLRARLDTLAATRCGDPLAGTLSADGITETWRADSNGRRWLLVLHVVASGRPVVVRIWTASVACLP